ncbi:MAG: hypothetical protein SVE93_00780 [Candidatus Thermoplasmatota archaeon]|nr:hypothetical protein [Candidatus Thermoplasmatota archaeon]
MQTVPASMAQDNELTTIEGQVKVFMISGTLIIVSIFLRVVVFLLSMPLRFFIEVLSYIGMERDEARKNILEILGNYVSEYVG